MPKINQEEYEVLKELDDKWKWIVRDKGTGLETYDTKPFKNTKGNWWWQSKDSKVSSLISESDKNVSKVNFQFIQHLDSEPYNIAELIKEYEFGKILLAMAKEGATLEVEKESEETEVKSKQELIEKWESAIEAAEFYGKGIEEKLVSYMKDFVSDLNQLDEPEVLSQEFIESNSVYASSDGVTEEYVHVDDLQNLLVPKQDEPETLSEPPGNTETFSNAMGQLADELNRLGDLERDIENLTGMTLDEIKEEARNGGIVPKQELPVIPKFVAEFLIGKEDYMLYELLDDEWLYKEHDRVAKWLYDNDELTNKQREIDLVMARDRGYVVEEEQKYYIRDQHGVYLLAKNHREQGKVQTVAEIVEQYGIEEIELDYELTEQEIKDYDERYWPFAVKVEELEE